MKLIQKKRRKKESAYPVTKNLAPQVGTTEFVPSAKTSRTGIRDQKNIEKINKLLDDMRLLTSFLEARNKNK